MTTTYLKTDPNIQTLVIDSISGIYNINIQENFLTTSTAMLGNGILISTVTIEKVKYAVKLVGKEIFLLDYEGKDIKIY
jgi:hypothetical protein